MNPPLKKKMKKHEDITLQFFIIFLFRFRVHHFTERKHSEKEKEHLIAKRKSYKSCTKWNYLSVDLKHCLAMYSECWDPLARLEWIPGIYFWTTFLTCLLADVVWCWEELNTLDIGRIQHPCPLVHPAAKVVDLCPPWKKKRFLSFSFFASTWICALPEKRFLYFSLFASTVGLTYRAPQSRGSQDRVVGQENLGY